MPARLGRMTEAGHSSVGEHKPWKARGDEVSKFAWYDAAARLPAAASSSCSERDPGRVKSVDEHRAFIERRQKDTIHSRRSGEETSGWRRQHARKSVWYDFRKWQAAPGGITPSTCSVIQGYLLLVINPLMVLNDNSYVFQVDEKLGTPSSK